MLIFFKLLGEEEEEKKTFEKVNPPSKSVWEFYATLVKYYIFSLRKFQHKVLYMALWLMSLTLMPGVIGSSSSPKFSIYLCPFHYCI